MVATLPPTGYIVSEYSPTSDRCDLLHHLPGYARIEIRKEGDSQRLYVICDIWVTKEVAVGPSYSMEFTHAQIIREQIGKVLSKFDKHIYRVIL